MTNNWVPFYFDTNMSSGYVEYLEDWEEIREYWNRGNPGRDQDEIYLCRSILTDIQHEPSFGSRSEHIGGKMTLGEFFDANGMDRSVGRTKPRKTKQSRIF